MPVSEPPRARARALPAALPRDLLPAIEPERRVDDWGRSERLEGIFDRTAVEFLYRYLFRVEAEGLEHVPERGGALLGANHSGALAGEAAMIARSIREEHPARRPVSIAVDGPFGAYPFLSMLARKVGCVSTHPANVHRLLHDERRLVLLFPEERKGTEKVFHRRYRLRRFGGDRLAAAAMRAGVPLVPVCVVGAGEASPVLASPGAAGRIAGLLGLPLTPTLPWLGPAGMFGYLPAKFRVRFLEPVETASTGSDPELVNSVAREARARIQAGLEEMLAARRSVWFG